MQYIDLHCDTLAQAYLKDRKSMTSMPGDMVDVERLKMGNALAQFFAIFLLPPGEEKMINGRIPTDDEYIQALVEIMHNTVNENPDAIGLVKAMKDFEENQRNGKASAILTIEDGRSVDGKMEKLEKYYDMGIRLISLLWNAENCFGAPTSTNPEIMKKGLTTFGRDAVARMDELGMIVDVSHLSDGGFYDVADICKGPFVASHSNCREIKNHPRNLTNDMIKVLANKGGVAGINFFGFFLNDKPAPFESRLEDMVAHIKHLYRYGGEDCIAIGTDFDGIQGEHFDVGSPDQMYHLFDGLGKAGFSSSQIEKIAYGNALRVMKSVLK